MKEQFKKMLEDFMLETGASFEADLNTLSTEMAASVERLASASGEPGFAVVLRAEGNVLLGLAALRAIEAGDRVDAQWQGMLAGSLRFAALALAGGVG